MPSINPTDHGIEFIKVVTFDLDDEDVILDGEIGADGSTLIRRAVGLFSVEALRRINDGTYSSHGKPPRDKEDRVLLPPLDPGDFHVFTHDIAWRRSRNQGLDGVEAANWLDKFDAALKDPNLGLATRKFCPVTWKTIEAALKQRLI